MPFDPNKPVQTKDGKPVRIICTDKRSDQGYSIVALVSSRDRETSMNYTKDGKLYPDGSSSVNDLVNVPEYIDHHFNILREEESGLIRYDGPFNSDTAADKSWKRIRDVNGTDIIRVALIHLRFQEGDGLVSPLSGGFACTASAKG